MKEFTPDNILAIINEDDPKQLAMTYKAMGLSGLESWSPNLAKLCIIACLCGQEKARNEVAKIDNYRLDLIRKLAMRQPNFGVANEYTMTTRHFEYTNLEIVIKCPKGLIDMSKQKEFKQANHLHADGFLPTITGATIVLNKTLLEGKGEGRDYFVFRYLSQSYHIKKELVKWCFEWYKADNLYLHFPEYYTNPLVITRIETFDPDNYVLCRQC